MTDTGKWVLIVSVAGLAGCVVYMLAKAALEWVCNDFLDRD